MCHVSYVICHMSYVMCHMSIVRIFLFLQSGEASRLRICYQQGYPIWFNNHQAKESYINFYLYLHCQAFPLECEILKINKKDFCLFANLSSVIIPIDCMCYFKVDLTDMYFMRCNSLSMFSSIKSTSVAVHTRRWHHWCSLQSHAHSPGG